MTSTKPSTSFGDAYTRYLDYEAIRHDDRRASAWIPVRPDLLDAAGAVRAAVVGFLVDSSAGIVCGMAAVPDWVITSDLQFRLTGPATVGPMRADATLARGGRTQVLGEVRVHDEGADDRIVALGTVNHVVIRPEQPLDVPADMPIGVRYGGPQALEGPLPALADAVGLRRLADHGAEIPIEGLARNPLGILHGGLMALLVEQASLDVAAGAGAERPAVEDVVLRFMGPVTGTVATAVPEIVATTDDRLVVRVAISSDGGAGRVGALATCAVRLR